MGESEKKKASECISQGSIDAGIVSSVNLGKGVDDFFGSSDDEISYGSTRLLPQAFQDDLCRLCLDPLSAQHGLLCFENLANSKLLRFNPLKSCFVILGRKKAREDLENQFNENPPLLYGKPLKINSQGSYLGDKLGSSVSEGASLSSGEFEHVDFDEKDRH